MNVTDERNQDVKRKEYRPETAALIETLSRVPAEDIQKLLDNIKFKEADKQRVYFSDATDIKQLHIEGPSRTDRADVIFLSALQDGLKKGDLASHYLNISPNHFSMIRNSDNRNKPNPDLIVIASLVNHQPFSVEDVNHVLMEIELPGLFIDTYDYHLNLRNYILSRILTHAQNHECPRERWIHFAWEALDYLGMKPLQDLQGCACDLSMSEERMLTQWMEDAKKECVKTDYTVLRRRYLQRFAEENRLSASKVINHLSRISYFEPTTIRDVFASKFPGEGTRGARETLILGAVHMGCTLEETNTLLRQANHALLYPFREDNTEISSMAMLLRNAIAKKELRKQEN